MHVCTGKNPGRASGKRNRAREEGSLPACSFVRTRNRRGTGRRKERKREKEMKKGTFHVESSGHRTRCNTRRGQEKTKRKTRKEESEKPTERKRKVARETAGQVDAASAQESGPCVTVESTMPAWESSNNAQRLSHNAPGATRGLQRAREHRATRLSRLSSASLSSSCIRPRLVRLLSRPSSPPFFLSSSSAVEVDGCRGGLSSRLGERHPSRQGPRETSSRCPCMLATHACALGVMEGRWESQNEIKASGEEERHR